MLKYGSDMISFLDDLKKMVSSIIVKQTVKASQFETVEIKKKSDRYMSMIEGGTEWGSFVNFDSDVLREIGIDTDMIDNTIANKELVPYELRALAMRLQKKKIIDEYVEENNYYRMMNGEPDIDDNDDILVGPNSYGVRPDVPITKLYDGEIEMINSTDLLDILVKRNPSKGYLQHLGAKSVVYYKARRALNYDILYIEKVGREEMCNEFVKHYANARNYVMRGLYNPNELDIFSNYDGFMGLTILVMAINRTLASIFSQGIEHNFYDDSLIRDFFKSYNMPYHETIAVKYQRELAKKLNLLLQKKSSNQVLFDIVSLFSYNQVNIYEYHLVKDYYRDDEGNPMIRKKEIINENGDLETVIDYEKTYELYFQKVNIKSENKAMEVTDPSNKLKYETVTGEDPYWVNDADLITKLYTNKFNSVITKYLSIDVAFDITQLLYETCHCFRLIFDANESTKSIKIPLPYVDDPVSLYDTALFVCALVAKKFKLKGEIPLDPWNVAQVYGFNFKTDIEYLKQAIVEDIDNNYGEYSKIDPALLSLLKNGPITDLESVKKLYDNIEDLRIFLDTAMRNTTSLEAYEAYQKIYNSVLVTTDLAEVYTKSDGTYASTFMDLLADRRPDLAEVVEETAEGEMVTVNAEGVNSQEYEAYAINSKVNTVLDILADVSENLNDLRFVNEKNEIVANIEKIINQMKSYTVDQQAAGIIYSLNDPHMCMLKILDYLRSDYNLTLKCQTLIDDVISTMRITHKFDDRLEVEGVLDNLDTKLIVNIMGLIKMSDELYWEINASGKSTIDFFDALSRVFKDIILPRVDITTKEKYFQEGSVDVFDYINLDDNGEVFAKFIDSIVNDKVFMDDILRQDKLAIEFLMLMKIRHKYYHEVKVYFNEAIDLIHEIWKSFKDEDLNLDLEIFDSLTDTARMMGREYIIQDRLEFRRQFVFEDFVTLVNKLMISKSKYAEQALEILDYVICNDFLDLNDAIIAQDEMYSGLNRVYAIEYLKYIDQVTADVCSHPKEYFEAFDIIKSLTKQILKHGTQFTYKVYLNTVIYDFNYTNLCHRIVEFFKKKYGATVMILDDSCQACADVKAQFDMVVNPKLHYWESYCDYSYFITLEHDFTVDKAVSYKNTMNVFNRLIGLEKYSFKNIFSIVESYIQENELINEEFILFDHAITYIDKDMNLSNFTSVEDFLIFLGDIYIDHHLGFDLVLDTYNKHNGFSDVVYFLDSVSNKKDMKYDGDISVSDRLSPYNFRYKTDSLNASDWYREDKDIERYDFLNVADFYMNKRKSTPSDNVTIDSSLYSINTTYLEQRKLISENVLEYKYRLPNCDRVYLENNCTREMMVNLSRQYLESHDTFLKAISYYPEEHLLYTLIYSNYAKDFNEGIGIKEKLTKIIDDDPDTLGIVYSSDSVEIIKRNKPLNIAKDPSTESLTDYIDGNLQ